VFFSDFQFDHPGQHDAFNGLMNYVSVQKLRTPKGLGWLSTLPAGRDRNHRLMLLQEIQNVFCATWTECVWLIADATKSDTKFIISDHPVTVYNRAVNAGEKMHRRAGVKMHHGRRHSAATLNSAFQFDQ
jgi:hypothetical protein